MQLLYKSNTSKKKTTKNEHTQIPFGYRMNKGGFLIALFLDTHTQIKIGPICSHLIREKQAAGGELGRGEKDGQGQGHIDIWENGLDLHSPDHWPQTG